MRQRRSGAVAIAACGSVQTAQVAEATLAGFRTAGSRLRLARTHAGAACSILSKVNPMSLHHAVVWLDHTKAQVIHFDLHASESESLKTHSHHPHPHQNHGDGADSDNTRFYNDIAAALSDSLEILVVGPAEEKTAFVTHLGGHHPAIAGKIKAVETVDHPSEGQLLAHARKHFLSAGGLQ